MAEETTTAEQSSSAELESLVHAALIAVSQGAVWPEGFDITEFAKEIFERGRRMGRADRAGDVEAAYTGGFRKGYRAGVTVSRRALSAINCDDPIDPYDPEVQAVTASLPLSTKILDLEFTVRTRNCLTREGRHTIGDVLAWDYAKLADIKNFGESMHELRHKLHRLGYVIDGDPEPITED